MTTEQFRERVLQLIREWLQNPKVQSDETAVLALNALAGDIQVIEIRKDVDDLRAQLSQAREALQRVKTITKTRHDLNALREIGGIVHEVLRNQS